ncbi:MAG: SDR family oxidoreductase [Acidobacteriota bacterium]|nr:SDR family oxidoreductase [Acidobacteriota bacterium]
MSVQLKRLEEQVMVITGASSGIGLVTARMAARRGAKLVLAARSEEALRKLADAIKAEGGDAVYVVADVGFEDDVRRVSDAALRSFGGFDTWVNNAGVSIYGRVLEVSMEDHRKLFETNYWGLVHGCRLAAEHLRERGGAIINVGSSLSDRAIPLQGTYCASKHAVKGYTDALRMELEEEGAPISITLIKPSAIDTPYIDHAKNYLAVEPSNPPPVYAPETVAEAILYCAENPERDVFIGAGGKVMSVGGKYAPRLTDKVMEAALFDVQQTNEPSPAGRSDGLYNATEDLRERGGYEGHVAETSVYTKASLHPLVTGAILLGSGLALAAWLRAGSSGRNGRVPTNA